MQYQCEALSYRQRAVVEQPGRSFRPEFQSCPLCSYRGTLLNLDLATYWPWDRDTHGSSNRYQSSYQKSENGSFCVATCCKTHANCGHGCSDRHWYVCSMNHDSWAWPWCQKQSCMGLQISTTSDHLQSWAIPRVSEQSS